MTKKIETPTPICVAKGRIAEPEPAGATRRARGRRPRSSTAMARIESISGKRVIRGPPCAAPPA